MYVGETKYDYNDLIFCRCRVKMNGDRDLPLLQQWLPAICHITGEYYVS